MKNLQIGSRSNCSRFVDLWRDRRGTAMLELTIMTPVLLTIGLGVMEFGNLIYKRHMIENGIRDAARYLAGTLDGCNPATGLPKSGLEITVANIATYGKLTATPPARVKGWSLPANAIVCDRVPAEYENTTLRGGGIGGVDGSNNPRLMLVKIETTVSYGTLSLGYMDILDSFGMGFNTLSFPVRHQERYYGTR